MAAPAARPPHGKGRAAISLQDLLAERLRQAEEALRDSHDDVLADFAQHLQVPPATLRSRTLPHFSREAAPPVQAPTSRALAASLAGDGPKSARPRPSPVPEVVGRGSMEPTQSAPVRFVAAGEDFLSVLPGTVADAAPRRGHEAADAAAPPEPRPPQRSVPALLALDKAAIHEGLCEGGDGEVAESSPRSAGAHQVRATRQGDGSRERRPAPPELKDVDQSMSIGSRRACEKRPHDSFTVLSCWHKQNTLSFRVPSARRAKVIDRALTRMQDVSQDNSCESDSTEKTERSERRSLGTRLKAMLTCWRTADHIIHPNSIKRGLWDLTSIALLMYDMVVLPLQFFELPNSAAFSWMIWVTRIFWTLDCPGTFISGYIKGDGFIELDMKNIAKHYAMTWLGMDVLLLLVDWFEVVFFVAGADDVSSIGRVGKASRAFRIVRMIRLLRLARLQRILKRMTFRMQSERLMSVANIAKLLFFMLANAHLTACCWYGLGCANTEASWIIGGGFEDYSLPHLYIMSVHWSIAQFNGGMDEIKAVTFEERVFNVVVFLLGFMLAAVAVSALTSSMTQLHILCSRSSVQLASLRQYLGQNGISNRLSLRVQRNARHAMYENERLMQEDKVSLLSLVSEPLRVEIHFEMYSPVFKVHPFFDQYIRMYPQVMDKVCHLAISTLLVSQGDVIFCEGEIPSQPCMYMTCNGMFEYEVEDDTVITFGGRTWLSEASLWTAWMHQGDFRSTSDGRLCVLDAHKFQDISGHFEHPFFAPVQYAEAYLARLNQMEQDGELISDMMSGKEHELVPEWDFKNERPHWTILGMDRYNPFGAGKGIPFDPPTPSCVRSSCRSTPPGPGLSPAARGRALDRTA